MHKFFFGLKSHLVYKSKLASAMPVKSYLAFPLDNQKEALKMELENIEGCEAIEAENKEVLVVVTESEDEKEDEALLANIRNSKHLKHISLVSGFNEEEN
jgi:nitrate reductase NapAB chaperone NapD